MKEGPMLRKEQLVELVSCQRRLVTTYRELHPQFNGNKWLIGTPARTELKIGAERWGVSKHGAGLQFTRSEPAPHLVVDMHEEPNNPERIDAWRVQQFLESLGTSIGFDSCESDLRAAANAGLLATNGQGYRLND